MACAALLMYLFLLTPLREGRQEMGAALPLTDAEFLLTPLREGRLVALLYGLA